jgi:hypothetical protein
MTVRLCTEMFKIIALFDELSQFAVVALAGSTRNCRNDKCLRNIQMFGGFVTFKTLKSLPTPLQSLV